MKLMGVALGLPLLLVACSSTTPPAAKEYKVEGTLFDVNEAATNEADYFKPWGSGAGTIEAKNLTAAIPGTVLATGTVNADGTFSVTLPAAIADSDLAPIPEAQKLEGNPGCTSELKISNEKALIGTIAFVLGGNLDGLPVTANSIQSVTNPDKSGEITLTQSILVYSSASTKFSGNQTCQTEGSATIATDSINADLKKGFNVLKSVRAFKFSSEGMETVQNSTLTNAEFQPRWSFDPEFGGLVPNSLAKATQSHLRFK